MEHPVPEPPELGEENGLAYALFMPPGEPAAGVVILHGAGSGKESHYDFARACRSHGLAALSYDARGAWVLAGRVGAGAFEDACAMSALLRTHAGRVAMRGTSMGGFTAIHAAALDRDVFAVVAVCPAAEDTLALTGDAAASLAGRCALMLMHAEGDEQVPYTVSDELFGRAGEPRRLLLMPGGHHRSLQHDPEMQSASIRWIERRTAAEGVTSTARRGGRRRSSTAPRRCR